MKDKTIGVIAFMLALSVMLFASYLYAYYMWVYPILYMWQSFVWLSIALTLIGNAVLWVVIMVLSRLFIKKSH